MEKQKQLIISVGREFGSGGHVIAEKLSQYFQLPVYDSNLLKEIALEKQIDASELEKYDELPKNRLFSRKVNGYSNSPEENIANMQFAYLQKKAAAGDSFIIIGRCAETKLKDCPNLVSIFILADKACKIKRIMELHGVSAEGAETMCYKTDKHRKSYHNYYCEGKWGDSRNYDISINSSKLGIDGTVDVLVDYIEKRMK
jgi:cytidylate kinase